jgi:hypothetical protein
LGLPELIKESSEEVEADDIKDEELLEKLREMGHPAKLFGESHKQRLRRFRKLGIVMTTGPYSYVFGAGGREGYEGGKGPRGRRRQEVSVQAVGFLLHDGLDRVGVCSGEGEERHICKQGGI